MPSSTRREPAARVEPVERGGGLVAVLVHRADPEAAVAIDATVVEAVVRGVVGRLRDLALELAVRVGEPDAVAQRDDEAALRAEAEAADRRRHRHRDVLAGRRIEAVERRRVDVDPPERLVGCRPQRAFAEARPDVEHAGERGGRHRGLGAVTRAAARGCASYKKTTRPARGCACRCRVPAGGAIERVGHVGDRLEGEEVAPGGDEHDAAVERGVRVDDRLDAERRPADAAGRRPTARTRGRASMSPSGRGAPTRQRRDASTRSTGSLRRVVLPHVTRRRSASVVPGGLGKNGWKPRPNGKASAPVFSIASRTTSVADVASADERERLRARGTARARRARPRPRAACSRTRRDVGVGSTRDRPRALPADAVDRVRRVAEVARECRVRDRRTRSAPARCGSSTARADSRRAGAPSPLAIASSGVGRSTSWSRQRNDDDRAAGRGSEDERRRRRRRAPGAATFRCQTRV